jgi:hypothetical protein
VSELHLVNPAQVESPIFQDLPRVPAPLGTFVHTSALFRNLPLADRASALPLLKPLLEHDLDESMYRCVPLQECCFSVCLFVCSCHSLQQLFI